jgi:hypothetical protein
MSESAYKCCTLEYENCIIKPISHGLLNKPNQEAPVTYQPNGYVDILQKSNIGYIWGQMMAFKTNMVQELDTEYDLELLRAQLQYTYGGKYVFEKSTY